MCTSKGGCLWLRLRTLSYRLPPTADAPDMTPERRLRRASGCGSCGSACRVACSAARLVASRLLSRLASFSCRQSPAGQHIGPHDSRCRSCGSTADWPACSPAILAACRLASSCCNNIAGLVIRAPVLF